MLTLLLAQAAQKAAGVPDAPESTEAAADAAKNAGTPAGDAAAAGAEAAGEAAQNGAEAAGEAAKQAVEVVSGPLDGVMQFFDELTNAGALGLMREGGAFMWPLLFLAVMALGVIIERWRSLKMLNTNTDELRADVLELLHDDRVEEAMTRCDEERGPVPAILSAGLRKYFVLRRLDYDPAKTEEQVLKSMEDYGVHVVAALERHLPVLATVAAVAPMIGFLGTVVGMRESFDDIVVHMGEQNIVESAASGIKVALLTTCFGLIVGIPAYLTFNYFTAVINRFVLDVEESAAELIEAVTLQTTLASQSGDDVPRGDGG